MPYGQRAKNVRGSQAKQSKAGADAKLSLHLLIIITSSSSSSLQTVFVHASLGLHLLLIILYLLLLHPPLPSSTHTLSFPFCVPPFSVLRSPCIIPSDTHSHTDIYILCVIEKCVSSADHGYPTESMIKKEQKGRGQRRARDQRESSEDVPRPATAGSARCRRLPYKMKQSWEMRG